MTLTKGGFEVSDEQAKVVDNVKNNLMTVVSAGAGSGKTYTMIATVFDLLDTNENLNIDDFILITFTNKAADEMREKLERAINKRLTQFKKSNNIILFKNGLSRKNAWQILL